MEPTEYLRIIRRRWALIVVFIVIGLGVGYLTAGSNSSKPTSSGSTGSSASTYQATAILGSSSTTDPSGLSLDAMAYLAQSGPVPEMTAKAIGDNSGGTDVAGHVQVSPRDSLNLLATTASEPTRNQAVVLANAFADQVVNYINSQLQVTYQATLSTDRTQLNSLSSIMTSLQSQPASSLTQSELGVAQGQYSQLYVSYQQLQLAGPQHTGLHVINPATGSTTSEVQSTGITHVIASTSKKSRVALGGLAGLIIGIGLALIRERVDTRVNTREQAERIFGLPVLAEIPRFLTRHPDDALVVTKAPHSSAAESFRMLQTEITLSNPGGSGHRRPRAILISSPSRIDGKAALVANLAACFSEAGSSVAVVAVDPSDASLGGLLAARNGTISSAKEGADPSPSPKLRGTSPAASTIIPGVSLLMNGLRPAGSNAHSNLVATGRGLAEVVLVDAPPALAAHEAARLSAVVDSVVLLCEIGRVTARESTLTVDALRRVGAPLHGVVLVAKPDPLTRLLGRFWPEPRMVEDQPDSPSPTTVTPGEVRVEAKSGDHFPKTQGSSGAEG